MKLLLLLLCVSSYVKINALHHKLFKILTFPASYLKKSATAAAAVMQLQQQYLYKSIQNVKLFIYTRFSHKKWIHINNYLICSCSCNYSCSCNDVAAVLQLQQQYPFESIQNVKQPLCTKFSDNIWTISQTIQFITYTSLISEKSAAAAAAASTNILTPWSWSLY